MKKRTLFLSCLLALVLSTAALAADYTDVPADSWARESIDKAAEHGLMNGVGEGRFGLGETISREQFVTILVRMFGWESVSGEDAAIDIADSWAREFVNTAAANGVIDAGGKFRPRDAITRREMAVMLVRALGLGELAKADADAALPFADVTAQRGYIAIAYEDFGMTTSHFILVHDDLTATQVSDLCDELKDVDGITQVVSLDSITGPGFDTELLPDSVMEILQSGGYKLILANSSYKTGTDAINSQLDEMIGLIKNVDPEGVITGEGAMTKDLIEVADVDFKNVNVWSIMAVLVIIAISFKSISIPVLLVASIEAAIAINMGIPYFTGTQLPFIASIVIGTIQLGATVDYSILMTTRYHEERAFGRTPKEAAQQSLEHCSQSILTSGLTFFAATVGVAAISKMELLRSICLLISRGALISMLVILPAALMLCDWLIRHTTLKWMVPESANAKKSEKE